MRTWRAICQGFFSKNRLNILKYFYYRPEMKFLVAVALLVVAANAGESQIWTYTYTAQKM